MTRDDLRKLALETCPTCGALPCDQVESIKKLPMIDAQQKISELCEEADKLRASLEKAERDRDAEAENCRLMQDRLQRLIEGNAALERERDELRAAGEVLVEANTRHFNAAAQLHEDSKYARREGFEAGRLARQSAHDEMLAFKALMDSLGMVEMVEADDDDNTVSTWSNARAEAAEEALEAARADERRIVLEEAAKIAKTHAEKCNHTAEQVKLIGDDLNDRIAARQQSRADTAYELAAHFTALAKEKTPSSASPNRQEPTP